MAETRNIDWIKSATNELNNLLQGILESSRLLQSGSQKTPETIRYFEIIRNSVERAVTVTERMQERAYGNAPEVALNETQQNPQTSSDEIIRISNETGAKELILVVDDEEFITLLAERILTDEGYRVITVKDGFSALNVYRKLRKQIDLVILDFAMPVMDGSEVFNELRLIDPDVAVVLSSGFAEREKLRSMLSKGLRGFVPKPYTPQRLLHQINLVLRSAAN